MIETSHQRPGKAASAALQLHGQYTPTLPELTHEVCSHSVIGLRPALPSIGKVRCLGIGEPPRSRACWNNFSSDCAHIVHHSCGFTQTVFADKVVSHADSIRVKQMQAQALMLQVAKQEATCEWATGEPAKLWHEITQTHETGYFTSKGLSATHGAPWHELLNCWLVLVTNLQGSNYTIQKIYNKPPPNTFYLQGGNTFGGMVILGSLIPASCVIVAEGIVTGCTLGEETGETLVCDLSCWNLLAVCTAIKAECPNNEIIVAGDDDRRPERNIGRLKATEKALAVGGNACYPTFCNICKYCTDSNDAVTSDLLGGAL